MPTSQLLVIGAGGHGTVVLDALNAGTSIPFELRDDSQKFTDCRVVGQRVIVPVGEPQTWPDSVHVAIGDNATRCRFGERVIASARRLYDVVHPRATVSAYATLGGGVFVAAQAVLAPLVELEPGVIVNHAAVVDHECRIGAWSHIAPGAVLGGGARIGKKCLIGSGAIVLPEIVVGDGAVIGSGAVVTRNVETGAVVIGIPARARVASSKQRAFE